MKRTMTSLCKISTKLIAIYSFLFVLLFSSDLFGATQTYTFTSKYWAATEGNWTSGQEGNQLFTGRGVQILATNTGANATSPLSFSNISGITVTYCTNASAGVGDIVFQIGANPSVSQPVTKTGGTTLRTLVYPISNLTGNVKITVNCTTNSIYINSVTINYASTPCLDATASFANATLEKALGAANFTNPFTSNNSSTKVFTSSNVAVATVDASTGAVSIVGAGSTTIQVTQVADATYCAVDKSYVLTVSQPTVDVVEVGTTHLVIDYDVEGTSQIQIQEQVTSGGTIADDLFFSKYFEAKGNVKLLAIYNGTSNAINLSDIVIYKAANAGNWTTGANLPLASYGTLPAGEELILYRTTNTGDDLNIMNCVQTNNPTELATWHLVSNQTLVFSGDDPICLVRKIASPAAGDVTFTDGADTFKMIDLIGARVAGASTASQGGVVAAQSFMDDAGWYCSNGEAVDGSPLAISTNRCLLIRKNTVLSGLNAVNTNQGDFNTLCTEWRAMQVPKDANSGVEVQKSCEAFEYVGVYDYSSYYTTYQNVTTGVTLPSGQNTDGTYTVGISNLQTRSCSTLRIQVLNGSGVVISQKDYKVPIIVDGAKTTSSTLFSSHGAAGCKECDVAVLNGAVLTKSLDTDPNDMNEVRKLEVYAGGKLVIPSGRTYKTLSVSMRSKGDIVPVANIDGTLVLANGKLYHDKSIDNIRYYFFTLPYNCNLSDLVCYNGRALGARGTDWQIKYYDGAERILNLGVSSNWKPFLGATLEAGKGYILAINAPVNEKKEVRFPMTPVLNENASKTVEVVAYGYGNASVGDNHKGWNLIGNPYLSNYGNVPNTGFKVGTYVQGSWDSGNSIYTYDSSVTVPYVTLPNSDGKTYTQTLASAKNLSPFLSFFVQVETAITNPSISFAATSRLAAPARTSSVSNISLNKVTLSLSGDNLSDETTLIVDDTKTSGYEIGADLEKMLGFAEKPQFYSLGQHVKLAFNALPVENASNIPLGFFAPASGIYTISMDNVEEKNGLDGVYLTDNVEQKTTNLLLSEYQFSSDQMMNDTRFSLAVVRSVTALSNVIVEKEVTFTTDRTLLTMKNLPENGNVFVYDVIGRLQHQFLVESDMQTFDLKKAGIYFVELSSPIKKVVVKVIAN